MRTALVLCLCLSLSFTFAGCSEKTGGSTAASVITPPPPPPPGGNPNPAPGTPDTNTDNSAFAQAVFQSGSTDMVVFTASLIGAAHNPADPGANGTLPPPQYRFRGEFAYNDENGTRRTVTVELATGNPPANPATLSASSSAKRISTTNPDVRFTLGVVDTPPPAIGTVSEVLVNNQPTAPTTGNVGYTFGFNNPTSAPLP